jgi:hypothetical protein
VTQARFIEVQPYREAAPATEVRLDLRTGALSAHSSASTAYDSCVLRMRAAANDPQRLLAQIAAIAQQVLNGSSVFDGNGHLNLAGDEAFDELCRATRQGARHAA